MGEKQTPPENWGVRAAEYLTKLHCEHTAPCRNNEHPHFILKIFTGIKEKTFARSV